MRIGTIIMTLTLGLMAAASGAPLSANLYAWYKGDAGKQMSIPVIHDLNVENRWFYRVVVE